MITPDGDNAVAPWKYFWDNTAHSPYLWNPLTSQMVTYDSPKSIQIKAEKIARFRDKNGKNLLGVKIFHVQGDAIEADKKEGRLVSAAIKGFKVEGSRGGSP